jgi:two-component system KDP operon response regulator KdpE
MMANCDRGGAGRGPAPPRIQVGNVAIDLEKRLVFRDGEEVHLTPTEMSLLLTLAREAGRVLTHRQILHRVWGDYAAENSPQLRVYINYLRRKLESDPAHPRLILTEPGVGYRLKSDLAVNTMAES